MSQSVWVAVLYFSVSFRFRHRTNPKCDSAHFSSSASDVSATNNGVARPHVSPMLHTPASAPPTSNTNTNNNNNRRSSMDQSSDSKCDVTITAAPEPGTPTNRTSRDCGSVDMQLLAKLEEANRWV